MAGTARVRLNVREDCHWWLTKLPSHKIGCAALECLMCTRGECGFYETEEAYQARQEKFKREHPNEGLSYQK